MNAPKRPEQVGQLARDDGTIDGGAILRLLNRPLAPEDLRDSAQRLEEILESYWAEIG